MFSFRGKAAEASPKKSKAGKGGNKGAKVKKKQVGAKKQFTTRHLAALDFLRNIPMKAEVGIRERGLVMAKRAHFLDGDYEDEEDEMRRFTLIQQQKQLQVLQMIIDDSGVLTADAVGTKMQGPPAPTVRVPPTFRYKTNVISDQAAVVRGWEDGILRKNAKNPYSILTSRVFVSRARAYPVSCFSVIGYDPNKEQARIERQRAEDLKGTEVFELPSRDWRGLSYKPLFKAISDDYAYETGYVFCCTIVLPSFLVCDVPVSLLSIYYCLSTFFDTTLCLTIIHIPKINHHSTQYPHHLLQYRYMHDPNEIDDPDMLHASNKFTAQRSAVTGPAISSVTLFVNEQTLKNELNEQFRERHGNLPPSLTLSKIRNLKRSALLGCLQLGLEVSTVAIAVVSMERLIMKGLVTKTNRRLSMAVCLLLAFKMNESLTSSYLSEMGRLLDFIDQEWHVSRKDLFEAEFGAYVHLNFSLHVPAAHLLVVYNRLLRLVNKSSTTYLGEDMSDVYTDDIVTIEKGKATERELRRRQREEQEERERREVSDEEEEDDEEEEEEEDEEEDEEEEEDEDEEEEEEDEEGSNYESGSDVDADADVEGEMRRRRRRRKKRMTTMDGGDDNDGGEGVNIEGEEEEEIRRSSDVNIIDNHVEAMHTASLPSQSSQSSLSLLQPSQEQQEQQGWEKKGKSRGKGQALSSLTGSTRLLPGMQRVVSFSDFSSPSSKKQG
jgi:hypothetical protein